MNECELCGPCPVCKRDVGGKEEHIKNCPDRAHIRGCRNSAAVVVPDRTGKKNYELAICMDHWIKAGRPEPIRKIASKEGR